MSAQLKPRRMPSSERREIGDTYTDDRSGMNLLVLLKRRSINFGWGNEGERARTALTAIVAGGGSDSVSSKSSRVVLGFGRSVPLPFPFSLCIWRFSSSSRRSASASAAASYSSDTDCSFAIACRSLRATLQTETKSNCRFRLAVASFFFLASCAHDSITSTAFHSRLQKSALCRENRKSPLVSCEMPPKRNSHRTERKGFAQPGDVLEISVLAGREREDEALALLKKIHRVSLPFSASSLGCLSVDAVSQLVRPIMKKHGFVLPNLSEFFPDNPNLLGTQFFISRPRAL